jgi:hypothetical protein
LGALNLLSPSVTLIKLFYSSLLAAPDTQAGALAPCKPFQPSLTFASKAGASLGAPGLLLLTCGSIRSREKKFCDVAAKLE